MNIDAIADLPNVNIREHEAVVTRLQVGQITATQTRVARAGQMKIMASKEVVGAQGSRCFLG